MLKPFFSKLGKSLSFVVLDYNRPGCAELCVRSIRDHVKIDNYEIIFYSNGGRQDYVGKLYSAGLIDKLILSKKNEGSGFATPRAVEFVQTEYFINLQCDNYICRDFYLDEFLRLVKVFNDNPDVGAINFTGLPNFSERAYLMNTEFYCKNDLHEGGGAGPYSEMGKNSETTTGDWIIKNNKRFINYTQPQLIGDSGKYSINEFPCGGSLIRRCDTQELSVVVKPVTKYKSCNLSDEEWDLILDGKWENWTIPKLSIPWIFFMFSNEFENPKNEIYRPR